MADLQSTGFFDGSKSHSKHMAGALADLPLVAYNLLGCTYRATTGEIFLCAWTAANTFAWIQIAGPGTPGVSSDFTFRPAGVTAGRTFTTWAGAHAAALAAVTVGGVARIAVDDSLAAANTTAGTFDMIGIRLTAFLPNLTPPTLSVVEGTLLPHLNVIGESLRILNKATATSPVGVAPFDILLQGGASIANDAAATVAFITVPAAATVSSIDLGQGCSISTAGATRVLTAGAASTVTLTMGPASSLGANSVTGAGAIVAAFESPSAAVAAQAGAGAFTITTVQQGGIYKGTGTLTAGTSAAPISAPGLAATSRILVNVSTMTPGAGNLTVQYSALNADRVTGLAGTFKITALLAAGTINIADVSLVDYIVML